MTDRERFKGRVATVTGGASGIGLAITRTLVEQGAAVVVADINPESLDTVRTELGRDIATVELDVRRERDVENMVRTGVDRFGKVDLGFNAAGLAGFGAIVDLSEEQWDLSVDVCLKGVFFSVKHQARQMIAQGHGGAIVNIASLNCQVPLYGGASYASAKAGVEMLGRNAALELGEHGVRVNTVSPGLTDTPLTKPISEIPGAYAAYFERIPLGRAGTPENMAAAALFLASDEAAYISGSNLIVDGAWQTTGYPDMRPFLGQLLGED